jgi:hypothetical protein
MVEKVNKNFLEFVNKKNKKRDIEEESEDLSYDKPEVPISTEKVYIYEVYFFYIEC